MDADSFILDFIEKEFQALRAKYGDPNPVFIPKLLAVNALFTRDVVTKSGISRPSSPDLDALRSNQSWIVRRRLLSTREEIHPELGAFYAFTLTEPTEDAKAAAIYYARETPDGPRIFSYDVRCCDRADCSRCKGSGWVYADGVKLAVIS